MRSHGLLGGSGIALNTPIAGYRWSLKCVNRLLNLIGADRSIQLLIILPPPTNLPERLCTYPRIVYHPTPPPRQPGVIRVLEMQPNVADPR